MLGVLVYTEDFVLYFQIIKAMVDEETAFMDDDYDQEIFLDVCNALKEPDAEAWPVDE